MYNNEHNVMNKVLWIICWLLFFPTGIWLGFFDKRHFKKKR